MIRFISVNIEGHKHLDRVKMLVETEAPDIVCVQEVLQNDLPFLMNLIGPFLAWVPMVFMDALQDVQGIAIISRYPLTATQIQCYGGNPEMIPTYISARDYGRVDAVNFHLLMATIQAKGTHYRIATTHAPVTKHGAVTPEQMQAIQTMLDYTKLEPELVLCGDFNAPRGRQSFDTIAAVYKDNIPASDVTSLDRTLHKAGENLPDFVVDGLFTTPHYQASNVRLQDGVSDHCAVVADITRVG